MSDINQTVDWNQVTLIVGIIPVHGYSDGVVINVVYDNERFSSKNGVDGEFTRVLNKQASATITITLSQGSVVNDELSALLLADLASNIPFPIFIKDSSGRTIGECPECYIKKFPDIGYGKEVQERSWEIQASKLDIFVGGNY